MEDGKASFIGELKNGPDIMPDENVFTSIWKEYERVIIESLITSFGLDFIVEDQYGGDVDTIHNVRAMKTDPQLKYKNKQNAVDYENRGEYNSAKYHSASSYIEINRGVRESKKEGNLKDTYTGKNIERNANVDLDHIISANEIHEDPGRILAGVDGKDLANCKENLKPTVRSINRSKGKQDMDSYLQKWEERQPQRETRIKQLREKENLSDAEKAELKKLSEINEINPDRAREVRNKAGDSYNKKVSRYYTSKKFAMDTAKAAGLRGTQMGARQALGFVFTEIWFAAKEEMQTIKPGCEFEIIFKTIGRGVKKGFENAKRKYKDIIEKFAEGFGAGILSSLTTTICNIFFVTTKNLVRNIRQIYASVVQAGKVLLFNPDDLLLGERIKTTTIILATGASVLLGTLVSESIGKTPIGAIPVIGMIVQTFCATLISGLVSCSLLIFLDRSKLMNSIINYLNAIPTIINDYAELADCMEALAIKLEKLDVEKFRKETEQYNETVGLIKKATNDNELNSILVSTYKKMKIEIPWTGDFDAFMTNKNNRLVFN